MGRPGICPGDSGPTPRPSPHARASRRGRPMTVDLTQFHDAFFEESFEALDAMEAALLKLDVGSPEPELINTIFRVAHSIKGGSATFGFSEIASFTHSLETLLDELRSGTMPVTVALSDLLLKSVDVMRAMLRAVQAKQPIDSQRVSDLQFDLEVAIARKSEAEPAAATPAGAAWIVAAESAAGGAAPAAQQPRSRKSILRTATSPGRSSFRAKCPRTPSARSSSGRRATAT